MRTNRTGNDRRPTTLLRLRKSFPSICTNLEVPDHRWAYELGRRGVSTVGYLTEKSRAGRTTRPHSPLRLDINLQRTAEYNYSSSFRLRGAISLGNRRRNSADSVATQYFSVSYPPAIFTLRASAALARSSMSTSVVEDTYLGILIL